MNTCIEFENITIKDMIEFLQSFENQDTPFYFCGSNKGYAWTTGTTLSLDDTEDIDGDYVTSLKYLKQ